MKISGTILFKEVQQFRSKGIWSFIILLILACASFILWSALSEKHKSKEIWIAFSFIVPVLGVMLYLFYITRFEKIVSTEGIYYKWWPFQRSYWLISKTEIDKIELRNAPFLSYGFHFMPGYGRVHNLSPGKGIQFTLRNGKKIFLGTQKDLELQTVLEKIMRVSQRL
jgi:hypothetical protein